MNPAVPHQGLYSPQRKFGLIHKPLRPVTGLLHQTSQDANGHHGDVRVRIEPLPVLQRRSGSTDGISDTFTDIDAGAILFEAGLAKAITLPALAGWYGNIVLEHTDVAAVTHWITASITNGRIMSISYDGTLVTGTQAAPGNVSLVSEDTV